MNRLSCLTAFVIVSTAAVIVSAAKPGDYPQWRGPNRDGISAETGLLKEWPEDGPAVVWQVKNVGSAYSAVSVADGRVLTQGNIDGESRILCLNEKDGKQLWSVKHPNSDREYKHGSGNGARGTVTVDGKLLYAENGDGSLTCLEVATGKVVWSLHLLDDLNGGRRPPGWGFCESPLIDGDKLIVTPGGADGAVAALNKLTGEVIWRSTDVKDRAHYSSAIVAVVQGVRQYIQFTSRRVVGLDAKTGSLLWDYSNSANGTANVCTPICSGDYVFTSSAYGTGGGLVKLSLDGDKFTAEEVYFERSMANHHGGIVMVDGMMYGFGSGGLICMDFKTGDIAWRNRSVRKGSLCFADGRLYCLGEGHEIALVEANPTDYFEKGRFPTPKSNKRSWAHPVVANGRLYIRDQGTLVVYDVSGN
jgi:outer membrane protein assembly factor BamB